MALKDYGKRQNLNRASGHSLYLEGDMVRGTVLHTFIVSEQKLWRTHMVMVIWGKSYIGLDEFSLPNPRLIRLSPSLSPQPANNRKLLSAPNWAKSSESISQFTGIRWVIAYFFHHESNRNLHSLKSTPWIWDFITHLQNFCLLLWTFSMLNYCQGKSTNTASNHDRQLTVREISKGFWSCHVLSVERAIEVSA